MPQDAWQVSSNQLNFRSSARPSKAQGSPNDSVKEVNGAIAVGCINEQNSDVSKNGDSELDGFVEGNNVWRPAIRRSLQASVRNKILHNDENLYGWTRARQL